jgi:tetratricopeptide (TPR) repeat protein
MHTATDEAVEAFNLGVMRFHGGDLDAAIEAFTRAIALDPEDASAWYNRGVCYAAKGSAAGHFLAEADDLAVIGGPGIAWYERACDDYTSALALAEATHFLVNRAVCLHRLGRRNAAIVDARRAAALGDGQASAFLHDVLGV